MIASFHHPQKIFIPGKILADHLSQHIMGRAELEHPPLIPDQTVAVTCPYIKLIGFILKLRLYSLQQNRAVLSADLPGAVVDNYPLFKGYVFLRKGHDIAPQGHIRILHGHPDTQCLQGGAAGIIDYGVVPQNRKIGGIRARLHPLRNSLHHPHLRSFAQPVHGRRVCIFQRRFASESLYGLVRHPVSQHHHILFISHGLSSLLNSDPADNPCLFGLLVKFLFRHALCDKGKLARHIRLNDAGPFKDMKRFIFLLRAHPHEEPALRLPGSGKLRILPIPEAHDHFTHMPCAVHHVRYHRAGCGKLSRSSSIIHGVAQHVPVDKDRIKHSVYHRKRMRLADHKGGDLGMPSALLLPSLCQKLDSHPAGMGIGKIRFRDFSDSFRINILIIYVFSVHKGGKNGNLAAGVIPFHVRLGIALRIALLLGFFQSFLKSGPLLFHFGKDIVGGAV